MALNTRCDTCNTPLAPEDFIRGNQPERCFTCREREARRAKLEAERRAEERNPHAVAARSVKIRKLCEEIDRQSGYAGLNAQSDGYEIARMARRWTALQWGQVSVLAACRVPSETTIEQIVAIYESRGRVAQVRAS